MNIPNDEMNTYIDENGASHYDLAALLHRLYKNNYRYFGKRHWKYYDYVDSIWKHDTNTRNLRSAIKTNLSDFFLNRYFFWYDKSIETHDKSEKMMYMEKANKLLKISYNLKMDNFISTVIKEARGFFDIHNYED